MFEKNFYFFLTIFLILAYSCEINTKNNLKEDYLVLNYSFDSEQTIVKVGGEYTINREGKTNKALRLNGKDEFVLIRDLPELNINKAITISIWFKPENFTGEGNNAIISKGNEKHEFPFYQYHIGIVGNKSKISSKQFTFSITVSKETYTLKTKNNFWKEGEWYNLIGTYDGNKIKFYCNNKLISEKTIPLGGDITQFNSPVCIGNFSNNINFYTPGTFDDLKIYNKAISIAKINKIYNDGN